MSTGGQHQRFATPFDPSPQLDQKGCQTCPKREFQKCYNWPPKGVGKTQRSPPLAIAVSTPFHPLPVHPSTSNGDSEHDMHLPCAVCAVLSLGLLVLHSSAMASTNKSSCRTADDGDTSETHRGLINSRQTRRAAEFLRLVPIWRLRSGLWLGFEVSNIAISLVYILYERL